MTTTPADELRAAADKLRRLAAEASTDPRSGRPTSEWQFRPKPEEFPTDFPPHGTLVAPDTDGRNRDLIHSGGPGAGVPWMFEAHGAYIAAMHPGVGAALADWLESYAYHLEKSTHPSWQETVAQQPLAVARAVNAA